MPAWHPTDKKFATNPRYGNTLQLLAIKKFATNLGRPPLLNSGCHCVLRHVVKLLACTHSLRDKASVSHYDGLLGRKRYRP